MWFPLGFMGCGNWAGQTPQQAGHYVTVLHPDFRQMFLSPPLCSLPWLSSWLVVLCLQISSLPIKMWDLEEKVHFSLHSVSITRKTTSFLLLGWSWASGIIPEHFVPRTDLLFLVVTSAAIHLCLTHGKPERKNAFSLYSYSLIYGLS